MAYSAHDSSRPTPALLVPAARQSVATASSVDPVVVHRSRDLLERAEVLFDQAASVQDDGAERFRLFYLAAIRASGAVLEIYEPSSKIRRRRGAADAWSRIKARAPQCGELAEYFGGLSTMRSQVEAGLVRTVDPTFCARVERRAMEFLDVADSTLLAYEQGKLTPKRTSTRRTVA
ncbi:MAG: SAV_6107 family HEPN domain-containing protein [Gordonia sp. (in: high G+C Gram-positive bacteria)]|uniref:SAV_6107 family HEPN domain-containing protein n=1 Tax=Gordonia sp. (in: high G+C Gram-positive bacteria) TaxID=84139 RepID=UPI003C73A945